MKMSAAFWLLWTQELLKILGLGYKKTGSPAEWTQYLEIERENGPSILLSHDRAANGIAELEDFPETYEISCHMRIVSTLSIGGWMSKCPLFFGRLAADQCHQL